jgi:hypothetical protein
MARTYPLGKDEPCIGTPICTLCKSCRRLKKGPRDSSFILIPPGEKKYCKEYWPKDEEEGEKTTAEQPQEGRL